MNNSFTRFIAVLVACRAIALIAQSPLTPVWVHTWPYGQGEIGWYYNPPYLDNHVAVDPVTDVVYATIDDQQSTVSMRWEYMHSFAADGTNLTPVPTPMLGAITGTDTTGYVANNELTRDLLVLGGAIHHVHWHFDVLPISTSESFRILRSDGTTWIMSTGVTGYEPKVFADASGSLWTGSMDATTPALFAVDTAGWLQWILTPPNYTATSGVIAIGNVVYLTANGNVSTFDRSTGQYLGTPFNIASAITSTRLATDGTDLYISYTTGTGPFLGKRSTSGTVFWDHPHPVPQEMEVDAYGRIWSAWYGGGGVWVTSADGSISQVFTTYGASMNGMALGMDQAYFTGWTDTATTETYLIAVSMDFSVGENEGTTQPDLTVVPQPASDELIITSSAKITSLTIMDARGRRIRTIDGEARRLDVSDLAPGSFLLRAETRDGPLIKPFVVAR